MIALEETRVLSSAGSRASNSPTRVASKRWLVLFLYETIWNIYMGCGTDQNGVVLFDIECGTDLSGSERCGFIRYGMRNRPIWI